MEKTTTTTTIRFGEEAINIEKSLDEVVEDFRTYGRSLKPRLVISDSTGCSIAMSSKTILRLLEKSVHERLALEPTAPNTPPGQDCVGFQVGSNYGLLLLDKGNSIIYRGLEETNGVFTKTERFKVPRSVIKEWKTFVSLGDNQYMLAPEENTSSLPAGFLKCSHCPHISSRKNMKRHERTHTGEKPYKCTQCSYRGSDSSNLAHHRRVHSGFRPHKCDQCPFAAITAFNLRRHRLTHTGGQMYNCPHCSYGAMQSSNLTRHLKGHAPAE
jgi:hypothetical protein